MFIRVKSTPRSPRKSVQIVESKRINGKVRQKVIKHLGVAMNDEELAQLKSFAIQYKERLELDSGKLPLYTPEEIKQRADRICGVSDTNLNENDILDNNTNKDLSSFVKPKSDNSITPNTSNSNTSNNNPNTSNNPINKKDYDVNLLDLIEEDRIIKGIHDVYGRLYDELNLKSVLPNPARNVASVNALKQIVLARIANPDSKRGSVNTLASNFGVNLNLKTVYDMMDKIDDKRILKLNELVLNHTKSLFNNKIDVIYFDATTLYFESFTEDEFKKNGYSKD